MRCGISPVVEGLVGSAATVGLAAYAVRGKSCAWLAPSIYHGDRSRNAIALTFDDGPSELTPALLELLAEHNVKATFFMCGANVRRLSAIARDVTAAGHEIGNHTDSHAPLYFKSPEFIFGELALAQETIHKVTRATPKFFRAPYGVRWPGLRRAQNRLNLTGVMWTAIGRDWKWPASRISRLLLSGAANGAILCLHDGRELQRSPDIRATLEAVELALPILKERGFSFETVSQLTSSRQIPR
jgi:peptidoglycan/xylan/chitin deacetylase (PgdA/CDA1 family)